MGFTYRPLKITATMLGPVTGDIPMLDSIIENQVTLRIGRDLGLTHEQDPERKSIRPGHIPTPIRRKHVQGFEWPIPQCSSPIFVVGKESADHFARRMEVDDPLILRPEARRVFHSNSGEFKSHRLPLRVRNIDRVVWFAVGVGKEVRRLLKEVKYLGKKTSQGYGRVGEWSIEWAEDDWSWFAPSEAGQVLMRPLPACAHLPDGLLGGRKWFGGLVPPYWCAEFFADGVVPC